VRNSHGSEVRGAVELRVQSYHETDVSRSEVDEDIPERKRKLGRADLGDGGRKGIVLGGVHRNGCNGLLLRRGEGEEVRGHPVEVTHVDSLKLLIPERTVSDQN
jgi:hypothetical protein